MTTNFDTLYARDSKGKILQWTIEVQQNGNSTDIRKAYGEYEGSQTLKWQRNIKGVNVGKSNETNSYEQAILEAESAIRNKKKRGYMTLEEAKEQYVPTSATTSMGVDFLEFKPLDEVVVHKENTLSRDLQLYLPKYRTDADGNVKPMKAQQYYRSAKDKEKDENGKTITLNYWTDPEGNQWHDRKYYYLKNPNVVKERNAIITKFPCMAQPKINGVRATIQKIGKDIIIKSKEGKIYTVFHLTDFLTINDDIFNYDGENLILDGELYIHGEILQDIGSAVDKTNLNSNRLIFVLFDIAIENVSNIDRWNIIKNHIKPIIDSHLHSPIEIIKTTKVANDAQAQAFTDICITKGYEGTIFRQFNGNYAFGKRPQDMTKLKRLIDDEFKIIDVVPQEKDDSKGNFVCVTNDGLRFEVNPQGTDDYKKQVLDNKTDFIGKNLTCAFYEWTKDFKPFHIVTNTVRDYE